MKKACGRRETRTLCYTEFVLKNMTITVSEDAARWARRKAAEENTSVSKLVGRMLEDQMRLTDEYWLAYERVKRMKPIPGIDASKRMTREEAHERR
jgi:hypothetical protein